MSGLKKRITAAVQAGRARATARPRPLSVRDAWLTHEQYTDQIVQIRGVVVSFEAETPREYFTLDDGPNRVGLRGEHARLRAQIGQRVIATGKLVFKPGDGIFLVVTTLQPAS